MESALIGPPRATEAAVLEGFAAVVAAMKVRWHVKGILVGLAAKGAGPQARFTCCDAPLGATLRLVVSFCGSYDSLVFQ